MLSDNWSDVLIIITLCVVTWGLCIVLIIFLELLHTYCYNTSSFSNFAEKNYFKHFMWIFFSCEVMDFPMKQHTTMQGLHVLTLLLHVIVLAQCQYCSCIYILLPRNSVFPLNSSRPTFPILAAYLREIIFKSLLKICPILSIQILDSRPYFNIS